jgi:hypothetical protein
LITKTVTGVAIDGQKESKVVSNLYKISAEAEILAMQQFFEHSLFQTLLNRLGQNVY